ncbi:MAG: thiol:disulfide interchange protein DsbG [Nevskiaceae bacterium]|nr:MAG: thiol:disulfide interchange protein DsbG [Nevskiaceae bacterium]TBR71793.1 MAG: thiol:disulfide interchange protein DsbG [Nevskiaceae bacterium]
MPDRQVDDDPLSFDDESTGPKIDAAARPGEVWRLLAAATWIAQGKVTAPRVIYEFYDASCSYCQRFGADAAPWVKSGKLQVRYIPVGFLEADSAAKAAALLAVADPATALRNYMDAWPHGGLVVPLRIAAPQAAALEANLQLMRDLGLEIVPGIVIRNADGSLQLWPGLPALADLRATLGAP